MKIFDQKLFEKKYSNLENELKSALSIFQPSILYENFEESDCLQFVDLLSTFSDDSSFKKNIPLILKCIANDDLRVGVQSLEISRFCYRLSVVQGMEWNSTEAKIIKGCIESLWKFTLSRPCLIFDTNMDPSKIWKHYIYRDCLFDWVEAFSIAYASIISFLDIWKTEISLVSKMHLLKSILCYFEVTNDKLQLKKKLHFDQSQSAEINRWMSQISIGTMLNELSFQTQKSISDLLNLISALK